MCRFFLALTLLLTGFGCAPTMEQSIPPLSTLPKVGETAPATLLVGFAQTGSMGSMPILNDMGEIQTIESVPVFLDESYYDQISAKLPACYTGTPLITVRATVTVEQRREPNTSIPDAPEETYYVAVVKNLESIDVKTQPCAE